MRIRLPHDLEELVDRKARPRKRSPGCVSGCARSGAGSAGRGAARDLARIDWRSYILAWLMDQ